MNPKIVWQSKNGNLRIVEMYYEDDDGDFTGLHVEQIHEHAAMGEPIWRRLFDNDLSHRPVMPEEYLKELLAQAGFRSDELD